MTTMAEGQRLNMHRVLQSNTPMTLLADKPQRQTATELPIIPMTAVEEL